ncbi:MAG TPA: TRAP transporter small permease subunit [Ideonella sp.]|uniref:TRAP transporter small permease subunit n=1 Tax=Ideonella sp. TaxID=1929293 RepID=UPI002E33BF16|nr:TRAP transporter small permease subunit [Ideonella sp.]HEX5687719.1 TRAP transporter small permease subunit [Ideonella sp.]
MKSLFATLLKVAHGIDWLTGKCGRIAGWAVILSCFISAANAVVRYGFDYSSNAFLEVQWYLFAVCVMLAAANVLHLNEHVRVDLFYARLTGRGKVYIDLFGLVFFLVPVMTAMIWYAWPLFVRWYVSGEMSNNAGGLVRWPAMLTLPVGFSLVLLQGASEIVKRIAWLTHQYEMDMHYERPLQ